MDQQRYLKNSILVAFETSSSLWAYAKDSSSVLKVTLEKVESVASPALPYASELYAKHGVPLIDTLDAKLVETGKFIETKVILPVRQRTASDLAALVVPVSWMKNVDSILLRPVDMKFSFSVFLNACTEMYMKFDKNMDGQVSFEEFRGALKVKLGRAFDERLMDAAKAFHAAVQLRYEQARELGGEINVSEIYTSAKGYISNYEETIITVFKEHLSRPSKALYNAAIDQYRKLVVESHQRGVQVEEFLLGMKTHLGTAWNESMEKPMREFLDGAKQRSLDELQHLNTTLDFDQDGKVTLSDFVLAAQQVVMMFHAFCTSYWKVLLDTAQIALDYAVPVEEERKEEQIEEDDATPLLEANTKTASPVTVTLTSMRLALLARLQKKLQNLVQRGQEKLGTVKAVTSAKAIKFVGADTMAQAEEHVRKVLAATNQALADVYVHYKPQLEAQLEVVKASLDAYQPNVAVYKAQLDAARAQLEQQLSSAYAVSQARYAEASQELRTALVAVQAQLVLSAAQAQECLVKLSPVQIEVLQEKIAVALVAMNAFVQTTKDYALHRELIRIPTDLTVMCSAELANLNEKLAQALAVVGPHLESVKADVQTLLQKTLHRGVAEAELPLSSELEKVEGPSAVADVVAEAEVEKEVEKVVERTVVAAENLAKMEKAEKELEEVMDKVVAAEKVLEEEATATQEEQVQVAAVQEADFASVEKVHVVEKVLDAEKYAKSSKKKKAGHH